MIDFQIVAGQSKRAGEETRGAIKRWLSKKTRKPLVGCSWTFVSFGLSQNENPR